MLTGAKAGELLNARHADLDLEGGAWRIPRSKSGKSRIVILNGEAKALFARQAPHEGNPYVFPGSLKYGNERMVSPQHAFERAKLRAGLKDLRIHDLRHSFASLAVGGGASLYDVQKRDLVLACHPYNPEADGYIVLVEDGNDLADLSALGLPYPLDQVPFEAGCYVGVFLANNQFGLTPVVPDAPWLPPECRRALEDQRDFA